MKNEMILIKLYFAKYHFKKQLVVFNFLFLAMFFLSIICQFLGEEWIDLTNILLFIMIVYFYFSPHFNYAYVTIYLTIKMLFKNIDKIKCLKRIYDKSVQKILKNSDEQN